MTKPTKAGFVIKSRNRNVSFERSRAATQLDELTNGAFSRSLQRIKGLEYALFSTDDEAYHIEFGEETGRWKSGDDTTRWRNTLTIPFTTEQVPVNLSG